MPNLEKLEKDVAGFPARAQRIIVHDGKSLTIANDFLQAIKTIRTEINDTFNPIIKKAHEAHKEAVAQKKKYEEPLTSAEKTIKLHIGSYLEVQAEIRRKAEEKARREEEERQRKEQEVLDRAKKYQDQGMKEEADAIIEDIPLPPIKEEPFFPEAEVEGLALKQILDTDKVNRFVETTEGKKQIPGIRIYPVWKWEITDRSLIPKSYFKSSVAARITV